MFLFHKLVLHICLKWIPVNIQKYRQPTSRAWDFMGHIVIKDVEAGKPCLPISDNMYCRFCFEDQLVATDGRLHDI